MTLTLELERLKEVELGLRDCADELEFLSETFNLEQMTDFWEGKGKEKYLEKVRPLLSGLSEQQICLMNSAEKLSAAVSRYAQTENELLSDAKQLSAAGIFD